MLLFMVQAQLEQIAFRPVVHSLGQPRLHATVYLVAISHDLGQRGAGHQPPLSPLDPFAQGLIVGIEQPVQALINGNIARPPRQDHRLEEPAGMGQMPLARTGLRHGLGGQILR